MFQKSNFCKTDSDLCVEVDGLDTDRVLVRNSQRPDLIASFDRGEWDTFIRAVKAGQFDLKTDHTADAHEMMEQV